VASYGRAFYGHRGGGSQELALRAGNDYITGGDDADLIVGDEIALFAVLSDSDNTSRYTTDRPKLTVKGVDRRDFEMGGVYSENTSISRISNDTILGGGGNDLLFGQQGAEDEMNGGLGDDVVHGGDSTDLVLGGGGNDDVRQVG